MNKQQASPQRAVLVAGLFLVLAAGAFSAAVYYFDGASVLTGLVEQIRTGSLWASTQTSPSTTTSPTAPPPVADVLALPAGMPESFALRLWQEQVDSQNMIRRLIDGEVKRLVITKVDTEGDTSTLTVRVTLRDGTTVPGQIVMRKFDDTWYVSTATADERLAAGGETPLPPLADVDIALLNTVIAEQGKASFATQEYADGKVESVEIGKAEMGPNTARIPVIMNEDHEIAYADLVAIRQEVDGRDLWVIARFGKTGSEPLKN